MFKSVYNISIAASVKCSLYADFGKRYDVIFLAFFRNFFSAASIARRLSSNFFVCKTNATLTSRCA